MSFGKDCDALFTRFDDLQGLIIFYFTGLGFKRGYFFSDRYNFVFLSDGNLGEKVDDLLTEPPIQES